MNDETSFCEQRMGRERFVARLFKTLRRVRRRCHNRTLKAKDDTRIEDNATSTIEEGTDVEGRAPYPEVKSTFTNEEESPRARDDVLMMTENLPTIKGVYQPLPSSVPRATRFLQVHKDKQGGISGSLHVHDLNDESFSWIALSYCWESDLVSEKNLLHEITLNGSRFPVKINLWRALNALMDQRQQIPIPRNLNDETYVRSISGVRLTIPNSDHRLLTDQRSYFWIDAICIDQDNIAERNHQVLLMKHIYSRAHLVIGWLTPFFSCKEMCPVDDRYRFEARTFEWSVDNNSYWTRMWIVQEFTLPQRMLLLLQNTASMQTVWVTPAADLLLDVDEDFDTETEGIRPEYTVRDYRATFQTAAKSQNCNLDRPTLAKLMTRFRLCECSDPRDKVFSLLALVSNKFAIQPDYTTSSLRLFTEVVHAEIQSGSSVDPVDLCASSIPTLLGLCIPRGSRMSKEKEKSYHPFQEDLFWFCCRTSKFLTLRAEDDKVAAFTDWLLKTRRGRQRLRAHGLRYTPTQYDQIGEARIRDEHDPQNWTPNPAIEDWIHLDEVRKTKGVSVRRFREIFVGTPLERLFDPEDERYQTTMDAIQQYRRECVAIRQYRSFPHDYLHGGPEQYTSFFGESPRNRAGLLGCIVITSDLHMEFSRSSDGHLETVR